MVEGEGVEKVAVGRCGWGSAKDSLGRKQQRKAGVRTCLSRSRGGD